MSTLITTILTAGLVSVTPAPNTNIPMSKEFIKPTEIVADYKDSGKRIRIPGKKLK